MKNDTKVILSTREKGKETYVDEVLREFQISTNLQQLNCDSCLLAFDGNLFQSSVMTDFNVLYRNKETGSVYTENLVDELEHRFKKTFIHTNSFLYTHTNKKIYSFFQE